MLIFMDFVNYQNEDFEGTFPLSLLITSQVLPERFSRQFLSTVINIMYM